MMIEKKGCITLINECLRKKHIDFLVNREIDSMKLTEIDLCIECVADVLCDEGFDKKDNPNSYGLELESVIDYLLNLRFIIIG